MVGADPEGSIYSGEIAPYKVEGVGEDFWPGTFDREIVDEFIQVTDRECFVAARKLARQEGILVGGSAGLALHAAIQVAVDSKPDDVIVVLLPDTGRNYLSKFFSDEWMRQNGYLQRLVPARVREVIDSHSDGVPELVSVGAGKSVGEAIDLMQQYGISQLLVTENGEHRRRRRGGQHPGANAARPDLPRPGGGHHLGLDGDGPAVRARGRRGADRGGVRGAARR